MKKIIMSTLAIAMMMTMASCSSSDNDVAENISENNSVKMTFFAICENSVGTRAKLDSENKVLWEEDDKISVNSFEYKLESGAGTTKGTFTKTTSGGPTQTKCIAVYPYMAFTPSQKLDAAQSISFPSEQTATEGTFDKNAALMVAYSDNGSTTLEFKNVGALVKVKPKFNCNKIVLNAVDQSVPLAGTGDLSYNGGDPIFTIKSEKAYSITLNGTIEKDKTYYIAVPAVTLAPGWSISFTDNTGDVYTRTGSKKIEFKRNTIINLGEFSRTDEKLKLTLTQNGKVPADKQVDMGVFTIGDKKYRVIFTKSNLIKNGLANKESDFGDYFAWGATEPFYDNYTYSVGSTPNVSNWKNGGYTSANCPSYDKSEYTENNVLITQYDAAYQNLGGNWMLPTKEVWKALHAANTVSWGTQVETIDDSNINGIKITKNNESSTYLFLPAAGDINGKDFGGVGAHLHYWTGSSLSNTQAYYLFFDGTTVYPEYSYYRDRGFTIRPVRLVE